MILFISSGAGHIRIIFRPSLTWSFVLSPTYRDDDRTMNTLIRKHSTSIFTFSIYVILVAFALACSLEML